jgi:hypothetical protein
MLIINTLYLYFYKDITQNGVTIPVDCMAPLKVETVHNNREISEALRALPAVIIVSL